MEQIMMAYNVGFDEQCFVPLSGDRVLSIVFCERSQTMINLGGGPIKMSCAIMYPNIFRTSWDIRDKNEDYVEFYDELEFYEFMNINKVK